jgi:hypothetical protein
LCPLSDKPCVREDCAVHRCVDRTIAEETSRQVEAEDEKRRLRPRIDPVTGKAYLPGKPEDYGL